MAPATYYLEREVIVLGIAGRGGCGAKGASVRDLRGRSWDHRLNRPIDGPRHELLERQHRLLERAVFSLDGLDADGNVRHLAIVDVIRCHRRLPGRVEVVDAIDDRLAGVGPFAQRSALGDVLGQPEFELDPLLMPVAGPRAGKAEGVVLGGDVHAALELYPADLDVGDIDEDALLGQRGGDVGEFVGVVARRVHHAVSAAKDALAGVEADGGQEFGLGAESSESHFLILLFV